jgi:hypothetical protein
MFLRTFLPEEAVEELTVGSLHGYRGPTSLK